MYKSFLIAAAALLASSGVVSADLVYNGLSATDSSDFFDETNWLDTGTGFAPPADTVNPSTFQIANDLFIGGSFNVVSTVNIRPDDGFTLTLQDNATLSSLVYSAAGGEEINIVVQDNADLFVTQNIARVALDLSGNADVIFSGPNPEFDNDSLNVSSDWTGSIEDTTTRVVLGGNATGLFNTFTIDGVAATNDDIVATDILDGGGAVVGTSFSLATTAVPEPSSLALLGLASLAMFNRRRK